MQKAVSERIKMVRKHYDLTQSKFADGLKIKQSSISAIEGGGNPDIETLINIGIVYKINLNWLLTGNGNMLIREFSGNTKELEEKIIELQSDVEKYQDEVLTLYREKAELERELKRKSG